MSSIGITAYTRPVRLYEFQPHAHLRGKDFRYVVVYPDGREETVLTVPQFDYHWQLTYELAAPLEMPAGSKLVVTAHYDNSPKNKHLQGPFASDLARNCGPDKQAYFKGQNQSWDEMFSPIVQYSRPAAQSPALAIVGLVGCLARERTGGWMLRRAGDAAVTPMQSTSRAELTAMAGMPLGHGRYRLLGAGAFDPRLRDGQTVAVKGVLISDAKDTRLNITSLQMIRASCD